MKVRVIRHVPHPPETVFACISDLRQAPPPGSTVELLRGVGAEATYRTTTRVGPHEAVLETTVTEWDPPWRVAWRTDHPALQHTSRVELQARGRGTRIVQVDEEHWRRAPWWLRWRARGLVRRAMARRLAEVEKALDAARG